MKIYHPEISAKGKKFAIVQSRFNSLVTDKLLDGARECLLKHGAADDDIEVFKVPGSFEIPQVAQILVKSKRYDAIICLGAVIRGETPHFDYIAGEVTRGIGALSRASEIPVVFGIITADDLNQALERAGGKQGNKGYEAAYTALEMLSIIEKAK